MLAVAVPRQARILDVGCGPGKFLSMLTEAGWSNLSGLDLSPDMLEVAREVAPQARFFCMPVQEMAQNLADRFDAITCIGVLHHIPDLDAAIHSLYDLLISGGVLIIDEPNADWFYLNNSALRWLSRCVYAPIRIKNDRRIERLRALWRDIPESPHHEDIDMQALMRALQSSGFVVEIIRYSCAFTRVVEGMLFRDSMLDRAVFRLVRWCDACILDPLAGRRAGACTLLVRKPA